MADPTSPATLASEMNKDASRRLGRPNPEAPPPVEDPDHPDYDGDAIVSRSSRGWARDADGWWRRPISRRDWRILHHDLATQCKPGYENRDAYLKGSSIWHLGDGCNASIGNGEIICRNAKQKRRLDNGLSIQDVRP